MYRIPESERDAITKYIFLEDSDLLSFNSFPEDEEQRTVKPGQEKYDVIFIPGCARPEHTEAAARLYHAGFAPLLIPSGGYTKAEGGFQGVKSEDAARRYGTDFTCEADFLAEVLRKNGVPEQAILTERTATYTLENAEKTRELLLRSGYCIEREGSRVHPHAIKKAVLCCKAHHARRSLFYYSMVFPEIEIVVYPVPVDGITRECWDSTTHGRETVLGELRRMGEQILMMEGRIEYGHQ